MSKEKSIAPRKENMDIFADFIMCYDLMHLRLPVPPLLTSPQEIEQQRPSILRIKNYHVRSILSSFLECVEKEFGCGITCHYDTKILPFRLIGQPVRSYRCPPSATKNQWQNGTTPSVLLSRDTQCHLLSTAYRVCVETTPTRLASLGYRLRLLPPLAAGWSLETDTRCVSRATPYQRRA